MSTAPTKTNPPLGVLAPTEWSEWRGHQICSFCDYDADEPHDVTVCIYNWRSQLKVSLGNCKLLREKLEELEVQASAKLT